MEFLVICTLTFKAPTKDEFGLLKYFESDVIQVKGIIVGDYSQKYSHWNAVESLGDWCKRYHVPAMTGVDTRELGIAH